MKRKILCILALIVFSVPAFGQDMNVIHLLFKMNNLQILEKIGLSEKEIQDIIKIRDETEKIIQETQLELNLLKAKLEKILYYENVNMTEVEKILQESHSYRIKVELAMINAYVKIRSLLGEERMRELQRLLWAYQERMKQDKNPDEREPNTDKEPKPKK